MSWSLEYNDCLHSVEDLWLKTITHKHSDKSPHFSSLEPSILPKTLDKNTDDVDDEEKNMIDLSKYKSIY